jgi:hypothetical protein
MEQAGDDQEQLIHHDHAFHSAVYAATGNRTLVSILDGLSSRTLRARTWRGVIEADASQQTIREHRAIHQALAAPRPPARRSRRTHARQHVRALATGRAGGKARGRRLRASTEAFVITAGEASGSSSAWRRRAHRMKTLLQAPGAPGLDRFCAGIGCCRSPAPAP